MPFEQKLKISNLISKTIGNVIRTNDSHTLMYHSVSKSLGENDDIYSINENLFKLHMEYLKEVDIDIVPFFDCFKKKNTLSITFDDGYQDTYKVVMPIMKELKIPFTVFVSPVFVQSSNNHYLDIQELLELSKVDGCTIGSHGYSHCRLTSCDDNKLKSELEDSKVWLEDLLSTSVNVMSYPHGDVNERVLCAVKKAGYLMAASSRPGGNNLSTDYYCLNRTDIWSSDDIKTFSSKINGSWDWMRFFIK